MKIIASRLSPLASRLSPLVIACACAINSAQAASDNSRFSYTWIEAGFSKLDIRGDLKEKLDGGYLRGSWDIGENFYLLGGYSYVNESWTDSYNGLYSGNNGEFHEKLAVDITQTEFGFGGYFQLTSKLDFYGDLTAIRLDGKAKYRQKFTENGTNITLLTDEDSYKDHLHAAKLIAGLRIKPTSNLELWGRAGYIRMEKEENGLLKKGSGLGNLGVQLHITPNVGFVGEAELYKDVRLYRAGLRVSF